MRVLTVKLDDIFAAEIDQFKEEAEFSSRSEMVREALKLLMVKWRKDQLRSSLERYLQDEAELSGAADMAEANMELADEALEGAGSADSAW